MWRWQLEINRRRRRAAVNEKRITRDLRVWRAAWRENCQGFPVARENWPQSKRRGDEVAPAVNHRTNLDCGPDCATTAPSLRHMTSLSRSRWAGEGREESVLLEKRWLKRIRYLIMVELSLSSIVGSGHKIFRVFVRFLHKVVFEVPQTD